MSAAEGGYGYMLGPSVFNWVNHQFLQTSQNASMRRCHPPPPFFLFHNPLVGGRDSQ